VTTFTQPLKTITDQGIIDPDGNEHEVDVLILATGFNTTWVPRFPITARGVNLQDEYRENPLSYLGLTTPGMPNYFTFYGPYGPLGQGSALCMIEEMAFYFEQMIKKLQVENIKCYVPRKRAAEQYQEHADLYNARTVWAANCRSWFKGGKIGGKIMLHPGTRTQ
jgi:cation diffusion facilitator CzcD-associated flavoprotein CzcO